MGTYFSFCFDAECGMASPLVAAAQQMFRGKAKIIRRGAQCQGGDVDFPAFHPLIIMAGHSRQHRNLCLGLFPLSPQFPQPQS